ncbi:MAG: O-antigen ligase family protein [Nitrospirota bacterium]
MGVEEIFSNNNVSKPPEMIQVRYRDLMNGTSETGHIKEIIKIISALFSILICAAIPGALPIIWGLACVYALVGPKQALQSLTVSWFLNFLNPGIAPITESSPFWRWMVLLSAFICVVITVLVRKTALSKAAKMLLLFSGSTMIASALVSYHFSVSFLKITQFTIGVLTILLGYQVTSHLRDYWKLWFMTVLGFIVFLSIPLFFNDIGYLRNGRSFQGLLNHPQSFGTFLSPFAVWLTGTLLINKNRSKWLILFSFLVWLELIASQSRTAFLSAVLGIFLALTFSLSARKELKARLKSIFRNYLVVSLFCFALVLLVLNISSLESRFFNFITKERDVENIRQGFLITREHLVARSLNNFLDSPLLGMGFGLASDQQRFAIESTNTHHLPLSAPTEKGFLPSALLEETGLLGGMLFIMFLITMARPLVKTAGLPLCWAFFTCIIINLGELNIFSFGGMGLYLWLVIGLSTIDNN